MSPVRPKFVCDSCVPRVTLAKGADLYPKASACPWQQAVVSIQPPHAPVCLGAAGAKETIAKPFLTPKYHFTAYMIKATVLGKVAMPATVSSNLPESITWHLCPHFPVPKPTSERLPWPWDLCVVVWWLSPFFTLAYWCWTWSYKPFWLRESGQKGHYSSLGPSPEDALLFLLPF